MACRGQSAAIRRRSKPPSNARCATPSTRSGARSRPAISSSSKSEGGAMIGRLNHVAIAVKDIEAASRTYRETLGAEVSAPEPIPEHGVTVVFITLPNTKIELLEPLGADSPIAKF